MEVALPEPERERLIPPKITSRKALEFQDGIKKVCRVRNAIIFCLIFLLLYWLFIAVSKCWLQPLSTDINYKYGEADRAWGAIPSNHSVPTRHFSKASDTQRVR